MAAYKDLTKEELLELKSGLQAECYRERRFKDSK